MQYNEILFSAETKEEELQRFIRFVDSNIQRIDCFRKFIVLPLMQNNIDHELLKNCTVHLDETLESLNEYILDLQSTSVRGEIMLKIFDDLRMDKLGNVYITELICRIESISKDENFKEYIAQIESDSRFSNDFGSFLFHIKTRILQLMLFSTNLLELTQEDDFDYQIFYLINKEGSYQMRELDMLIKKFNSSDRLQTLEQSVENSDIIFRVDGRFIIDELGLCVNDSDIIYHFIFCSDCIFVLKTLNLDNIKFRLIHVFEYAYSSLSELDDSRYEICDGDYSITFSCMRTLIHNVLQRISSKFKQYNQFNK